MESKVYLVGAGPGDPGLITVKGQVCIQAADIIIYDYLAAPALLAQAPDDAEIIYVGKKGGDHTLSQEGINALLVEKARHGTTVVRLKGGDPFIFGRGGEEAEALIDAGIPFEVVPGVTSAIAAPAYAGIPLTHRHFTSTVAFITGHEDPTKTESSIDWNALVRGIGTLVFLMGVKNLPNITRQLKHQGLPDQTPVALVRWGTTSSQVTVSGTLATIEAQVEKAGLTSPAIIVVGKVVQLREKMKWFETRPLLGKRIIVTRAREQASHLVARLSDLGAECLQYPTIEVNEPADWKPLDDAIQSLSVYHWMVFTSVNGVRFFFKRLFEKGLDVRSLGHLQTACIGPATAEKLLQYGIKTDILPQSYRAESIVDAFENETIQGKRILLPRAREARPILPVELTRMGATVDEITAYCTESVVDQADSLLDRLQTETVDLITFTSSSTVKNFNALIPAEEREALLKGVVIASIGPITTDTATALGYAVHITADTYTVPGLCEAILNHFRSSP